MNGNIPSLRLPRQDGTVVARDGIVVCFFMRHSHQDVAPAVWRALQTYVRAIPPNSLNWYGSEDGDTLPLDAKGWEHIRWKLLERPWGVACIVELEESDSGAGGYNVEYQGLKLDDPLYARGEGATSSVAFTWPTEYLFEHGAAHLRDLCRELARELPFSFGYASLAFVSPRGMWFSAGDALLDPVERYLGFDLYHLGHASRRIGTRARGTYWLTFLGQPLLGQLGGVEGLRQRLAFPEVSFQPMAGERLLLTLGDWSDPIDTAKELSLPQYRALAHLLEPYLYDEGDEWPHRQRELMLRRLGP